MNGHFWKNKVTLRVNERVFGDLMKESTKIGVSLEKIYKVDDEYFFTMTFKDYEILNTTPFGHLSEVVKKRGAGYFAYLHRKRYGFYVGALLSLLIMVYLTSCIWVVDVVGNEETSEKEIKAVLNDCGIGIGKIRYGKKISEIKNRALLRLDTLAWLWVRIEGTRAIVEVREKGDTRGIFARDECYNLVAAYGGLITDMRVRHGRKVVGRGDVVNKGDLLVSGVSDTRYNGIRFIHANGEVIATTWRKSEGEFEPFIKKRCKTGKSVKRIGIRLLGHNINNVFKKDIPFEEYDRKIHKKQLKLFENIYLPLTFTTEEFYEIIIRNEPLEGEALLKRSVDALKSKIESCRTDGAKTLSTEYEYTKLKNGNLYVKLTVESLENIAQEAKIEVEIPEEDTSGESN